MNAICADENVAGYNCTVFEGYCCSVRIDVGDFASCVEDGGGSAARGLSEGLETFVEVSAVNEEPALIQLVSYTV